MKVPGQVLTHADGLAALAGKDKGEFHFSFPPEIRVERSIALMRPAAQGRLRLALLRDFR
jgi:hypothetical protein